MAYSIELAVARVVTQCQQHGQRPVCVRAEGTHNERFEALLHVDSVPEEATANAGSSSLWVYLGKVRRLRR
jgi:hypothetical protein